ncbi:MAG: hypothetical protein EON99_00060 [Chitinophagaceae bacterium]|nr:MAG: hypothetical protein EON99_00060 [Chitinophagaceae bacterium]
MDFAFAPGITRYDRTIRLLYRNRAETILINEPTITDVAGYVHHLNSIAPDPTTAGTSFHIGTHGDDNAWMWVPWDISSGNNTTWEDLDNAHNAASTELQDEIILPRPTGPDDAEIPPKLLIKGCRIALSQAFMDKMKEAINGSTSNTITVTAPKFYHALIHHLGKGIFEHFLYDFKTFSRTRITTRANLITALVGENHSDIHSNIITEAQYKSWVPTNINAASNALQRVSITPTPIPGFTRRTTGRYRHTHATVIRFGAGNITPPAGADDQAALFISLLTETADAGGTFFAEALREDHPFPIFTRFGYTSIEDMVNNLQLTYTRQNATNVIITGKRHEYDVNPPVVDTDGRTLIFNYYAIGGSGTTAVTNFTDTDDRFYITT